MDVDPDPKARSAEDDEIDPEREARRRLALAQIRQYPDVALRMTARPVEDFDDELRSLTERMERLMTDALGIGLAATQVGIIRRLFVFQPSEDETAVVVNPEIAERSEETSVADEGCLSIQGILVPVERALTITLTGRDANGEEVRFELDDIYARAAQHELDHLDGVLIIDRTTPEARREALSLLRPRIVLT
ncbi:MAG TPA: peptide deformylase [Gaiellaceae bacterium]|nr:peptide deformylase [Gaiellaceae bacterium]